MYLYIQKGVFLSSKGAFPKVLKGVAPKNFPGASPPDPHLSLPPTSRRLAPPLLATHQVFLPFSDDASSEKSENLKAYPTNFMPFFFDNFGQLLGFGGKSPSSLPPPVAPPLLADLQKLILFIYIRESFSNANAARRA